MDNLTNKVNASAAAYDKLTNSMMEAAALRDAELTYNNSMVDGYTRRALAINELAKQQELLGTTDESKRAEIESKYSATAAGISGMAETQKEANVLARSLSRENELQNSINAAEARRLELIKEAESALRRSQQDSRSARADLSFSRMFPLIGTGKESFQANSAAAKTALGLTGDKIQEAQAIESELKKLQNAKEELLRAREVAGLNSGSGQLERAAADVASQRSTGDRRRANEEAMRPAFEQLDTELADFHSADQKNVVAVLKTLKEEGNLTVEAIKQWTDYLRQIKDGLNRQRYQ
jgi:hypothetical protein